MTVLDKSSAQAWCLAHGFLLYDRNLPALRKTGDIDQFSIPQDAGARVALVRGHMQAFQDEDQVCVWVDDWDVWPSGQHWHIFERFRLSYGIAETIASKPCHLVPRRISRPPFRALFLPSSCLPTVTCSVRQDDVTRFTPIMKSAEKRPNKAPEPTTTSVTSPACAGAAPAVVVAHL